MWFLPTFLPGIATTTTTTTTTTSLSRVFRAFQAALNGTVAQTLELGPKHSIIPTLLQQAHPFLMLPTVIGVGMN